jgi:Ca2+-binding EF-hand superfamily protein
MKSTTLILALIALGSNAWAQDNAPDANQAPAPKPPRVPLLFTALDADEDGEISAAEIAAAAEALIEIDANGDGKITPEEVLPPKKELNPFAPKPMRRPPPVVEALDIDQDGKLSAEELKNATESLLQLDANGDGELTGDEMAPPPPADGGEEQGPPPPQGKGKHQGPPPRDSQDSPSR